MLLAARIAVVVPAFREARLIGRTLRGMPGWVDRIVVVDDASPDDTDRAARAVGDGRLVVARHDTNRGVGAAIATGYRRAMDDGADVMAVMAGDAQMDPADLERVLGPVVEGRADYVKGNRFLHPEARCMPLTRRLGGAALSALTRLATGLAVDDTQCGYTALSARAAARLPLTELWPRYGYPNDLLGMAAAHGLRVAEVPVRPVYGDETSGVRPWHVAVIAGVVARRAMASADRRHSGSGNGIPMARKIARSTAAMRDAVSLPPRGRASISSW